MFSPDELSFPWAVLLEQHFSGCLSGDAVGFSQRDNEGVVGVASVGLLSPSSISPQHCIRGLRYILSVPCPLYSTDHAGVELH